MTVTQQGPQEYDYDLFICHASADKDQVVRPLVESLRSDYHLRVWLDEIKLIIGDSISREIDQGIVRSRFGVVVLSHAFFSREWPKKELGALLAREADGELVILPVWHDLTREDILGYSPTLADRYASKTAEGLNKVATDIADACSPPKEESTTKAQEAPSSTRPPTDSAVGETVPAIESHFLKLQGDNTQRYARLVIHPMSWDSRIQHREFEALFQEVRRDAPKPYQNHGWPIVPDDARAQKLEIGYLLALSTSYFWFVGYNLCYVRFSDELVWDYESAFSKAAEPRSVVGIASLIHCILPEIRFANLWYDRFKITSFTASLALAQVKGVRLAIGHPQKYPHFGDWISQQEHIEEELSCSTSSNPENWVNTAVDLVDALQFHFVPLGQHGFGKDILRDIAEEAMIHW